MFLLLLVVCVVLCAFVVYLPQWAGLTHIEKNAKKKTNSGSRGGANSHDSAYDDTRYTEESGLKAKASALKERIQVTTDDVPYAIKLNNGANLRKRHDRISGDTDPDKYDYDLDELIQEETDAAVRATRADFYRGEAVDEV